MPMGLGIPPKDDQPVLVSIQTTGTRSLKAQMMLDHVRHADMPANWHWMDTSINPWHVPVRDLIDHMVSITLTNVNDKENIYHRACRILCAWDKLICATTDRPETTFYRTIDLDSGETYQRSKGIDHPARHDWESAKELDAVQAGISWLYDRNRLDWFHQFYPQLKFEESWHR